jgi:putative addiction module component (TIGR02574 family)
MSKTQPPPGFDDLSVPEQIDYVNSLWERIASRPSDVPIPDWHRKVLEDRLKRHREEPDDVQQWEEVRDNARDKVRRARQ